MLRINSLCRPAKRSTGRRGTLGAAALVGALALIGCSSTPVASPRSSGPPATPATPATPTLAPVYGLTWALVQDVARPEGAFAIPSDLPTAPTGPGTAGHPGHFPGQSIISDVAVAADRLIAVGYTAIGGIWTADAWSSEDGVHWTASPIDARPGSFAVAITVARDGTFVAVGRSGTDASAWTSTDGARWRLATVGRLDEGARAGEPERMTVVRATPEGLLAGGSAGPELGGRRARFWESGDGARWVPIPDSDGFEGAEVVDLADDGRGLVALGSLGVGGRPAGSIAWVSSDGASWDRIDDPALATGIAVAVIQRGSELVAVGSDVDEREAVAWTSTDGLAWTRAPAEPSRLHFGEKVRMTDVVATAAGLVGVGNFVGVQYGQGTSWLSADARTWTAAPLQPALGQGEPEAVVTWGDRLLIVGSRGAPDNYIPSVWISPGLP
jgi:hypothetical protein